MRHVERIVGALEWLHASVQEHTRPWCFVLVDTLHLTHCVRPGVVKWNDVEAFDLRVAELGCKLLFLRAGPATIWERGIKPRRNDQFVRGYANKFGRTEEEIHSYFVREQEELAQLFSRSVMPKLLLQNDDVGGDGVEEAWRFWTDDLVQKEKRLWPAAI